MLRTIISVILKSSNHSTERHDLTFERPSAAEINYGLAVREYSFDIFHIQGGSIHAARDKFTLSPKGFKLEESQVYLVPGSPS